MSTHTHTIEVRRTGRQTEHCTGCQRISSGRKKVEEGVEEHAARRLSVVQQVHGQQAPTGGAVHLSCPPLQAGIQGHAKACAPPPPPPHTHWRTTKQERSTTHTHTHTQQQLWAIARPFLSRGPGRQRSGEARPDLPSSPPTRHSTPTLPLHPGTLARAAWGPSESPCNEEREWAIKWWTTCSSLQQPRRGQLQPPAQDRKSPRMHSKPRGRPSGPHSARAQTALKKVCVTGRPAVWSAVKCGVPLPGFPQMRQSVGPFLFGQGRQAQSPKPRVRQSWAAGSQQRRFWILSLAELSVVTT